MALLVTNIPIKLFYLLLIFYNNKLLSIHNTSDKIHNAKYNDLMDMEAIFCKFKLQFRYHL